MKVEELEKPTVKIFFDSLVEEVGSKSIVQKQFYDFVSFLPGYDSGQKLGKNDIQQLAILLDEYRISSQPRVKQGYLARGIEENIYLYKNEGDFNHNSENYRYALSLMNVAVLMARVDGELSEGEVQRITTFVGNIKFITDREKQTILARAYYYMQVSDGENQKRSFLRLPIDRDNLLKKIGSLGVGAQNSLLDVAMDIAVSDGFLDRNEIYFLQDMYRAMDRPARAARPALEAYAKDRFIKLEDRKLDEFKADMQSFEEVGDVLGDLLSDFEDF